MAWRGSGGNVRLSLLSTDKFLVLHELYALKQVVHMGPPVYWALPQLPIASCATDYAVYSVLVKFSGTSRLHLWICVVFRRQQRRGVVLRGASALRPTRRRLWFRRYSSPLLAYTRRRRSSSQAGQ